MQIAKSVDVARHRAVDTYETSRQIIAASTELLSEEAKARFPKYDTIRRQLCRDRKRDNLPFPNPATIYDINIPAELAMTKAGEPFVLFDSGANDQDRYLILGTRRNFQILQNNPIWSCDGTFKVCPEMFYQLWSIHAFVNCVLLPQLYVFMTRKTEELYGRVLTSLFHNRVPHPNMIICDFEMATIDDENCRINVKMIASLAFVRMDDVIGAFETLQDIYENDGNLMSILEYFEDSYIGRVRRNIRQNPRFPITLWNCHQLVIDNLPQTNNNIEGWHHAFQRTIGLNHPTVYKLVEEALRVEQSLMETRREQLLAGHEINMFTKASYRQINQRLQNLINDYDNRPLIDFLRGCSYNFDF